MGKYKRCAVVFNLENPLHADLYAWCMEQSTNFSDLARSVLFAYRENMVKGSKMVLFEEEKKRTPNKHSEFEGIKIRVGSKVSDRDAMSDLL